MITSLKATYSQSTAFLKSKISDYSILVKVRLNLTVVFSAIIGYLLAVGGNFLFIDLFFLGLAGFLVTGSANAINQIIEKDYDRLMKRTKNRPLAANRMSIVEALLVSGVFGIAGLLILGFLFNTTAALIGAISLFSYAFVYTPMKRISPFAVFVGAIPGALPPVIGWVAATSLWSYEASVLFSIQFLWQFPHFWAIGWLGAEEYEKAGYKLSPNSAGKNKYTAVQIIVYIVTLIVVSLAPYAIGLISMISVVTALLLGGMFLYYGYNLYRECDDKAALKLMFASIVYLPGLQTVMVLDRLFFL
ncbi:MAG: heme o synthase [Chitinophagales bacterium]